MVDRDSLSASVEAFADLMPADDLEASVRARLAWRWRVGGKACSSCGDTKPVSAFGRDSSRSDGLEVRCKECRRRPRP